MSQALSDVSFSSGLGRHKYGNSTTHFTPDGRLITTPDDYPEDHRAAPQRDFRSLDPARDRYRQYPDRYGRDNDGRDFATTPRDYGRELPRDFGRERDYNNRRQPPVDYVRDNRDWVKPNYESYPREPSRGFGNGPEPVYGRTLPLPSHRDYGPPSRRHDDYRPRDGYGKIHYDRTMPSNSDWRMPFIGENGYDKTGLIAQKNYGGKHGMLARTTRRKQPPKPISWFFVIIGVLLLACALVNLLICTEHYYYCFFWVGAVTLELGIVGILHKGNYRNTCQNIYYIGTGIVVMIVAFAGTALVLRQYVPQLKDITKYNNLTEYVVYVNNLGRVPIVKTINTDLRIWLCLGFDSAALVLLVADYFSLYATIKVGHRYWNTRNVVTKPVSPFCKPNLFNPFAEMLWGEALVFLGLLTVFACEGTEWNKYWSPVWTGGFLIVTGGVSSWAAKNPYRTKTSVLGVIFNFLGAAICSVCIVMCVLGLKDNIETIIKVGAVRSYSTDRIYASAIIFSIAIALTLVCFFYCLGLVVRFGYYMTRSSSYDKETFTTESRSETTVSTVRGRYGYDGRDPPLPTRANHNNGFFARRWR